MTSKICVVFLIPSLVAHGAERQLCELVKGMDRTRFEIHVVVFYEARARDGADFWDEVAAIPQVTLHCLNKRRGGTGYFIALPRLLGKLMRIKPAILHGYMDANLATLLLGRLMGKRVVTLTFILCATGYALSVYALFVLLCDVLPMTLGFLRTFGQNPLAAYLIHERVSSAVRAFSPHDAPWQWALGSFFVYFAITYLFVKYLENHRIYLRM